MSRNNDTYSMLETREWTRGTAHAHQTGNGHVSHVSQTGSRRRPVGGGRVDLDVKILDHDWHNVLQGHLSGV